MMIVVKYFASISDAVGKTSEKIEFQHTISAGELWSDVSENIKYTGKVMIAVNHEYVEQIIYLIMKMKLLSFLR